jgi:glycosyltransferase involved in cell wall biosynthesis
MIAAEDVPLTVAIDARSLQGESTGVGTYTSNLVRQLVTLESPTRVVLVGSTDLPKIVDGCTDRIQILTTGVGLRNNFLWSNLELPRQLRHQEFTLFHSPGYTIPLWLRSPKIVTIHDVSYAANPAWYPYRNGAVRRAWYRLSARRADCILTISEFSRREIVRLYDVSDARVRVVYLGVDRERFRAAQPANVLQELRLKYDIWGDFLLYVGDIHRRRNVSRILDMFESIKETGDEFARLELVLIGRFLDSSLSASAVKASRFGASVHVLGHVPATDLPVFYALARAFVFPSSYEGFGLGVLEAMACGCPAIVGRGTACEEIGGAAVIPVDADDVRSFTAAVLGLLRNRDLAAGYSAAGRRRSDEFSWRKTALQTRSVYGQLAKYGNS